VAVRTDELISRLSLELEPSGKRVVGRTLAIGLTGGMLGSVLLMTAMMGARRDLMGAMAGGAFWLKLIYTATIAGLALWIVERAGRPGATATRPLMLLAFPIAGILILVAMQLSPSDTDRHALVMGHTAKVCGPLIVMLAIPLLAGMFWALRQLAPTRLRLAGASVGLLSGSVAASVYAFHCPENTAPFVAVWYTSGILLVTLLGAGLGRWALRW
jgi:hypothetical protein